MTLKDLERVLYFEYFVVVEPGLTALKMHQLLTEDELLSAQDEFGEDSFEAMIGAEAMKTMLCSLDLEEHRTEVCDDLRDTGPEPKRTKLVKRPNPTEPCHDLRPLQERVIPATDHG